MMIETASIILIVSTIGLVIFSLMYYFLEQINEEEKNE